MKLGIYVGSFNPVHKGHIEVINHLINNNYVDKVIMIPTGNYWDKTNLIDVGHRIRMCELLENDNIIVLDSLNNIPYTYMVMDELHKIYKEDDLYLIIGADNIITFDKWVEYKKILKDYVIVIPRDGIDINLYVDKYIERDRFILVSSFKENDISSSLVRKCIVDKKDVLLKELEFEKIINYIKKNGLYIS